MSDARLLIEIEGLEFLQTRPQHEQPMFLQCVPFTRTCLAE